MRSTSLRKSLLLAFLTTAAIPAADFMPLETGNHWLYREPASGATLTVRAGTPASMGGNTYYRLTGYVTEPVWARVAGNGSLYYYHEEQSLDLPLTAFHSRDEGWYQAPLRECPESTHRAGDPRPYAGQAGRFAAALPVLYRTLGCADVGPIEEVYVENVGMLSREVTTIAGPRRYELVYARVGKLTLGADPSATFRVSVSGPVGGAPRLIATLRLSVSDGRSVSLRYPTSQDFDVLLKDDAGATLWQWSADKVFTTEIRDLMIRGERVHEVEIPLKGFSGDSETERRYRVEA